MRMLTLLASFMLMVGCQADEPSTPPAPPAPAQAAAPGIYKCTLPNGTTLYSDTHCNPQEQVIPLNQLRPMSATPTTETPEKAPLPPAPKADEQHRPPDSHAINTRYDNLSREINSLFEYSEKAQLSRELLILEKDRSNALSMTEEVKQSHDINTRFDNMAREIRAHNKSKALAHQLLELERMRNQALYTY